MNDLGPSIPKEKERKGSVMLPMMNNSGSLIENKGKGVSKPEEVIGGMDNYKKYQMLVESQKQMGGGPKDYKRSLSLLDNSNKKTIPKRTTTMESNNRKKTNKITTDEDSSGDNTPTGVGKKGTTATFGLKK